MAAITRRDIEGAITQLPCPSDAINCALSRLSDGAEIISTNPVILFWGVSGAESDPDWYQPGVIRARISARLSSREHANPYGTFDASHRSIIDRQASDARFMFHAARSIARIAGLDERPAGICAALHDLGKVALTVAADEGNGEFAYPANLADEQDRFGITHTRAGRWIAAAAAAPRIVERAMWLHHIPVNHDGSDDSAIIAIVRIADAYLQRTHYEKSIPIPRDAFQRLGLNQDAVEDSLAGIDREIESSLSEAAPRAEALNTALLQRVADLERDSEAAVATAEALSADKPDDPCTSLPNEDLEFDAARTLSVVCERTGDALALIRGYAAHIADTGDQAAVIEKGRAILEHVHQAEHLLANAERFMSRTEITYEPILLNFLAHDVVEHHIERLRAKGIRVEEVFGQGLPRVPLDRSAISHAITELVTNAEDAMRRTGGVLTLITRTGADGESVELSVRDTGRGVSEDSFPGLFEPFHVQEGNLGLAVARRIAEAHGGHLEYRPGDDGGHFVLSLPVAAQDETEPDEPDTLEMDEPIEGNHVPIIPDTMGAEGIWVVSQDAGVRDVIAEILRMRGFAVAEGSDLPAAAQSEDVPCPESIVIEVPVHDRTGKTARELADDFAPHATVIVIGGSHHEFRSGSNVHVVDKPFRVSDILTALETSARSGSAE